MANEWHYTLNGQPAAVPVSVAQLKQLAASGQLKPTDLVWSDGMMEWAAAGSVKGLFPSSKSLGDSGIVPPPSAVKPVESRKTIKMTVPHDWMNMHPVTVLVLTLLTAGIFGLIYAYKVSQIYGARGGERKLDTAGHALGRVRHPLGVLFLSYLTLGFYFYYWAYRALLECNEYLGKLEVQPRAELSLMLIFPPYAFYVTAFLLPEQIRKVQALAGVPETPTLRHAVLFLAPCLLIGLPLLGMICQETLNQVWLTAP